MSLDTYMVNKYEFDTGSTLDPVIGIRRVAERTWVLTHNADDIKRADGADFFYADDAGEINLGVLHPSTARRELGIRLLREKLLDGSKHVSVFAKAAWFEIPVDWIFVVLDAGLSVGLTNRMVSNHPGVLDSLDKHGKAYVDCQYSKVNSVFVDERNSLIATRAADEFSSPLAKRAMEGMAVIRHNPALIQQRINRLNRQRIKKVAESERHNREHEIQLASDRLNTCLHELYAEIRHSVKSSIISRWSLTCGHSIDNVMLSADAPLLLSLFVKFNGKRAVKRLHGQTNVATAYQKLKAYPEQLLKLNDEALTMLTSLGILPRKVRDKSSPTLDDGEIDATPPTRQTAEEDSPAKS